jgi:hypothetical protein
MDLFVGGAPAVLPPLHPEPVDHHDGGRSEGTDGQPKPTEQETSTTMIPTAAVAAAKTMAMMVSLVRPFHQPPVLLMAAGDLQPPSSWDHSDMANGPG